jgi:hypothetical protein
MKPQQHLAVRLHGTCQEQILIRTRSFVTSETTGVKLRHRKPMTVKNLGAYIFNSGDPDTVTVHSRKNGANGNLTCSIGSSNALGHDTSHSDSLAVGDDYDFSFARQGNGGRGSGNNMITVDYISTNGDCILRKCRWH